MLCSFVELAGLHATANSTSRIIVPVDVDPAMPRLLLVIWCYPAQVLLVLDPGFYFACLGLVAGRGPHAKLAFDGACDQDKLPPTRFINNV
eukprot:288258-Pyramimonas_sp.AAC.1